MMADIIALRAKNGPIRAKKACPQGENVQIAQKWEVASMAVQEIRAFFKSKKIRAKHFLIGTQKVKLHKRSIIAPPIHKGIGGECEDGSRIYAVGG